MKLDLVEVQEGTTELLVPEFEDSVGPKETGDEVFYNPSMEKSRDIFVSFLNSYADDRKIRLLDGMGASGIRGIRASVETPVESVTINDLSEKAIQLIKKNVKKKSLDVKVTNEFLEKLLINNKYEYDFIDIDPFGSPVDFFPLASRFVNHEGVVALSATDTAALCGTYPSTCLRRYSSRPENNWCRHENGLRILIAYCVREAARYDRWVKPLISYYEGHHFRTYLQIGDGARKADKCIEKVKKTVFKNGRWLIDECDHEGKIRGPFWVGQLFDSEILEGMTPVGKFDDDLLSQWKKESEFPPFFYDTNELSSVYKTAPPPVKKIRKRIEARGFRTSKTHFLSTGIKTDASFEVVKEIFLELTD